MVMDSVLFWIQSFWIQTQNTSTQMANLCNERYEMHRYNNTILAQPEPHVRER